MTSWDTGVLVDTLKYVGVKSVTVPSDLVSISTLLFIYVNILFIGKKFSLVFLGYQQAMILSASQHAIRK